MPHGAEMLDDGFADGLLHVTQTMLQGVMLVLLQALESVTNSLVGSHVRFTIRSFAGNELPHRAVESVSCQRVASNKLIEVKNDRISSILAVLTRTTARRDQRAAGSK